MSNTRPQSSAGPPRSSPYLFAQSSSPYSGTLPSTSFRLLRLDGVGDSDYPLHCELETYGLGDCPEYETVSYCWGGEDNDNRQRYPVFVGPYWDVLLQMKNCADMLRYLHPLRGFRLVWVDHLHQPERRR
jgi:heterokaryon incompatibility protein (HET)